ncbi:MAG: sulfatase-like hydrolase/transferase [Flavobacteriaceae bacterium]|nr:sulfatase-like hydrolase/transferase [Flavobacteriaceae bacterium]
MFFNYLAVIVTALVFVLFHSNFEQEIALNCIENALFAVILISISYLMRNNKFRRIYGQLAFIVFSLTMIFETLYYLLFKVFISPSTLYLFFDTNTNESIEFIQSYIGRFEIFSTLALLAVSLFCYNRLKNQYASFGVVSVTLSLKIVLLIGITLGYLKWSTHIIYNLPYLSIKSFIEYSRVSKQLDVYTLDEHGLFEDASSSLGQQNEGVYVLILGESTARSHMGLYGYERQTTPRLNSISNSLWTFNDVISPNTHTIESVTKMLTRGNYENLDLTSKGSIIQLANAAGFKTIWLSNQRPVGVHESLVTKIARSAAEVRFMTTMHGRHNRILDQDLLPELDAILDTPSNQPKFIIVHLSGTHMLYENRYPEDEQVFLDTPNIAYKSYDNYRTVNHYDNAVLYTDFIINNIIQKIKGLETKSTVLYLSDHGEELFQDADFSGHNEDVATKSMYDIPFFLWQSDIYKKDKSLTFHANRKYMADDFFHTMAHVLQISSTMVDTTRSIFSKSFKIRPRLVLTGQDYDTLFDQKP